MKRIFISIAALMIAAAPSSALAKNSLEGRWANPKRSVIVSVSRCGGAYCGTVAWANEKTRGKVADKGRKLIGTRILSDLKPAGGGVYKGRAYEPKRNLSGSATVRQVSPDVMLVKGCAILGMLCKEQRWTRVS